MKSKRQEIDLKHKLSSRAIDLTPFTPIASGLYRWVYEVPAFPNLLLKIRKTGKDAPLHSALKRPIRGAFPKTETRWLEIETSAFVEVSIRAPDLADTLLPRFHGIISTTQGPAFAYEKLCDGEGGLAPTLAGLLQSNRFTSRHIDALNDFFELLRAGHIVANDIHEHNIVYSKGQFYLIDGLGDRNLIRIRSLFPYFNARSQERKCIKIARSSDFLTWDSNRKRFALNSAFHTLDPAAG